MNHLYQYTGTKPIVNQTEYDEQNQRLIFYGTCIGLIVLLISVYGNQSPGTWMAISLGLLFLHAFGTLVCDQKQRKFKSDFNLAIRIGIVLISLVLMSFALLYDEFFASGEEERRDNK